VTIRTTSGATFTARTAFERLQLSTVIEALRGQLVRNPFKDTTNEFDAMRRVEYGGREGGPGPAPGAGYTASPDLVAAELYAVAQRRIRQTLRALDAAIEHVAGFPGRKAVLLYSEGFIKSPSLPDYDRVIERARLAHAAVYVVDPRGLESGLPMPDDPVVKPNPLIALDTWAGGSTYVATSTGGRVSISNDATSLYREAAAECAVYYILGFAPRAGKPGERKITVRVRRDEVVVRAPSHYIVGGVPAPAVAPAIRAIHSVADRTSLPLRVTARVLTPSREDGVPTTVAIEIGNESGEPGQERRFDLLIEARAARVGHVVRDSAGLTVRSREARVVATRELLLRPGLWQMRVVVEDRQSSQIGSVLHTFTVPGAADRPTAFPAPSDETVRRPN
jgi:VWFA-related protein